MVGRQARVHGGGRIGCAGPGGRWRSGWRGAYGMQARSRPEMGPGVRRACGEHGCQNRIFEMNALKNMDNHGPLPGRILIREVVAAPPPSLVTLSILNFLAWCL